MSKIKENYTTLQLGLLLTLRFLIGWHIMYEGLAKVLNPGWSAAGYLKSAQWVLTDFFHWIISEPIILSIVDFVNVWGLIAIGAGVIVGCLYKFASISGFILLMLYYIATPPMIGLAYAVPVEGSNLIVNKTLIEAVALLLLVVFPTNKTYGLDYFLYRYFRKNK
ncbi:MAG: DoxX subfamily [Lentimicrobium sp.]|jgi:thiosulfate dehydrogenase [quinone] large subunit|nr:DoxX subfamily [Lentimicrobium sp.]